MKKKIIILLLLIFVGGFVIKVILDSNSTQTDSIGATFQFDENLAIITNKEATLNININNSDVIKVELKLNDSVLQKWDSPKNKVSYILKTKGLTLGTKKLTVTATLSDNTTENDERLIRILNNKKPDTWRLDVTGEFPHRDSSYTQGLEFYNGTLFEGTGDPGSNGHTLVAQVDKTTGKLVKKMGLDATHFGEGISVLRDTLYQLTYKNQKCLTYDAKNLTAFPKEHKYIGEGWGLCNDGRYLIMSNGTEQLVFRNPTTFEVVKTIEAYTDEGPITQLNELEYIDGLIYANVYTTDLIAVINPNSGAVVALINAGEISSKYRGRGEVLNGIAYNKLENQLFITGKYWNKLLAVTIKKTI
jgi:glutamine cyclotransferase